eukprot:758156-Hanusia_phi.AAC.1
MKLHFSIPKLSSKSSNAKNESVLHGHCNMEKSVVQRRRNSAGIPNSSTSVNEEMRNLVISKQNEREQDLFSETSWISFFSEEDTPAGRRAKW